MQERPSRRFPFAVSLLSAAGLCATALAQAPATAPSAESELQAIRAVLARQQEQLQAQQQEILLLREKTQQNWASTTRSQGVDQTVREVLADADARSRLATGVSTGGYDGKMFFLKSADDSFLMNLSGFMQLRYVANFREDADESLGSTDDDETGFQIRRAKLLIGGHVSSPKITYLLQIAGNRDAGGVDMEQAVAGYKFSDELSIRGGRFKGMFLREESVVGATRQLAVERSLVNAIFTLNYIEGVELVANPSDAWRLTGSVNDGLRSGDPGGIGNDFYNDASDVAFTARADAKLAGTWEQMADFASWSGEETGLFVGGAVHYELAETGDGQAASPGVDDFMIYSADAAFESEGFNAMAAFVGRYVNGADVMADGELNDFGVVAQAGYMVIPDKLEPFARYEWIDPDSDRGFDEMNLVTVGANYYLRKHASKFTLDVVWALDEVNDFAFSPAAGPASGTARTGLGLLPDSPGSDGQIVVRAQFQVAF